MAGRNVVAGLVAALALGCAPQVHVEASPSPSDTFSRDRTFRFLSDLRVNEITDRVVRFDIARALVDRGYVEARGRSDLLIDYSLTSSQHLYAQYYESHDPMWDSPPKWGFWPERELMVYQRATLSIAVLDGEAKRPLWRGTGVMDMPDDANERILALDDLVDAVMRKFPGYPTGAPWPKSAALRTSSRAR